jgi:transcriptional regulator with XRE-family HTH domain
MGCDRIRPLPQEGDDTLLGERIRAVRQERQLTVRELAREAGLSPALISQVERGINDPSLDSLRRIAQVLEVPLFNLFQQPLEAAVPVIRAKSRMQVRSPHGDLAYSRLSPGFGKLEVLEGTLLPGGCSSQEPWSHPSEECVVVVKGTLVVEVDAVRHVLKPGDSCYFDSRLPHRYINEAKTACVFQLSVTPPSF